jgi:hypothetical protein
MAVQGTGLPLPKDQGAPSPVTPTLNMDAYTSAAAWQSIARTGAQIASDANDVLRTELHQRQVGYLADQEIDIARNRTEMRDKFANDPAGFDAAWKGYTEGKITNAEPWAIPHIKRTLGSEGNGAYQAILGEKRAVDQRLDSEKITTLAQQSSSDYVASAMAGSPDPMRLEKFKGVLATAVTSRLMTQEKADMLLDETAGRAQGEVAARTAVDVYRKDGYEAAVTHLRQNILENDTLGLKPAEKRRAFSRGLEAITLERRVDREDRVGLVDESKDIIARLKSNQQIEPGTIQGQLDALKRVGAWSAYRDLYVEAQVTDLTAPYRTGAVRPAEFAKVIGGAREAAIAGSGPAQQATQFFVAKGYTREQAAGIVGNLIQESGLDTKAAGDGGISVGLAQWNKGRRDALNAFAAARGASPNDFQTQLEFVDHELNTTETTARDALRAAKTPADAAAAFIHFERPLGYTPDNPMAGHGSANRVRYAQAVAGGGPETDANGMPYGGIIVKRAQQEFASQMRKEWPEFQRQIKAGKDINAEDFDAIRMAAAVSGDAAWIKDVEEANQARLLGKVVTGATIPQGQAAVDEIAQKFNDSVTSTVKAQFDRRVKMVTENPVDYAVENGRKPPDALNFGNPQALRAGVVERVNIARAVAQDQQVAPGNPFRASETSAISGAITSGKPEAASAALGALSSLPDDMLLPALKNPDIRAAITGAARSPDAARYNAAMTFADGLWQRAPETAKQILGEDTVHALMTWQSNSRFMTPDQIAKERDRAAGDPQLRARQQANESEGRKLARALDPAEVVKQFDTSWWITPGPIARALGSQPVAPTDAATRDTLMGDYENTFARRYAETLDKDIAAKQTMEILKTKWQRSEVNGGKLMLRAPETTYPAINGSWGWMKDQLETDLSTKLGPRFDTSGGPVRQNWDYSIVSDRRTEAEAQAGQRPSYSVVITDKKTGKSDVVRAPDGREFRYAWDSGGDQAAADADFNTQRQRVLNPAKGVAVNLPAFN